MSVGEMENWRNGFREEKGNVEEKRGEGKMRRGEEKSGLNE